MNTVSLIGRLTKDPEFKAGEKTSVARFSIAINRGKDKNGNDLGADYPNIVCFGRTAELVRDYTHKGDLVGIDGVIRTGSYEKDGKKVYTTDINASRVEFLSKREKTSESDGIAPSTNFTAQDTIPGFESLTDDDLPF